LVIVFFFYFAFKFTAREVPYSVMQIKGNEELVGWLCTGFSGWSSVSSTNDTALVTQDVHEVKPITWL